MSKMPLWAKIVALVLLLALFACAASALYKSIKGDGGPDNSIFDNIFGDEPPVSDTASENYFGEKSDGEYVSYLTHNLSYTSDGLTLGYINSNDGDNTLYGFSTDLLVPSKEYCLSWSIDSSKLGDLSLMDYGDKFCLRYSTDYTAGSEFTLLYGDKADILNNEWYFTMPADGGSFTVMFAQSEYVGDDVELGSAYANVLKEALVFTVSVVE